MSEFTCQSFDEFEAHYGTNVASDTLSRICESAYQPYKPPMRDVTIENIHRHNAVNMTITGYVNHAGIDFFFEVEDGDWNGTVVTAFSTQELAPFESPTPVTYTMVPTNGQLKQANPAMYGVYLAWMRETWFSDLVRQYNYDRYVQPGVVVEQTYKQAAQARGLKWVSSDCPEALQAATDLAARYAAPAHQH